MTDEERFRYRADVLVRLWAHGVQPTERTPPALVRGFVRDLYKYEIRRLRERYLQREFPKADYWHRVDALRRSYPVLALPARYWLLGGTKAEDAEAAAEAESAEGAEDPRDRE